MILKNNEERKQFLEEYAKWDLIDEVKELKVKFFKIVLPTKAVIIATEWQSPGNKYVPAHKSRKYALIIDDTHTGKLPSTSFGCDDSAYSEYDLDGVSENYLIDYLRKNKCNITIPEEKNVIDYKGFSLRTCDDGKSYDVLSPDFNNRQMYIGASIEDAKLWVDQWHIKYDED